MTELVATVKGSRIAVVRKVIKEQDEPSSCVS